MKRVVKRYIYSNVIFWILNNPRVYWNDIYHIKRPFPTYNSTLQHKHDNYIETKEQPIQYVNITYILELTTELKHRPWN